MDSRVFLKDSAGGSSCTVLARTTRWYGYCSERRKIRWTGCVKHERSSCRREVRSWLGPPRSRSGATGLSAPESKGSTDDEFVDAVADVSIFSSILRSMSMPAQVRTCQASISAHSLCEPRFVPFWCWLSFLPCSIQTQGQSQGPPTQDRGPKRREGEGVGQEKVLLFFVCTARQQSRLAQTSRYCRRLTCTTAESICGRGHRSSGQAGMRRLGLTGSLTSSPLCTKRKEKEARKGLAC